MGLSDLSEIEIIQGSFALVFVLISIILGARILVKYFKHKRKEMITIGLSWILLSSGWWGVAINFPLIILFDYMIPALVEITINHVFIPLALICWIYTFCSLAYEHLKKKIVPIYVIISIVYEIISIYFLFTNPSMLGTKTGTFNITISMFALSFIGFALITTLITGILFAKKSLQSDDKLTQLKGKIIMIAFISFVIGAIFDAAVPLTAISLIIVRLILISSAFFYYLGFLMPEKLSIMIIKKE